jgi:hypothetical protein
VWKVVADENLQKNQRKTASCSEFEEKIACEKKFGVGVEEEMVPASTPLRRADSRSKQ